MKNKVMKNRIMQTSFMDNVRTVMDRWLLEKMRIVGNYNVKNVIVVIRFQGMAKYSLKIISVHNAATKY